MININIKTIYVLIAILVVLIYIYIKVIKSKEYRVNVFIKSVFYKKQKEIDNTKRDVIMFCKEQNFINGRYSYSLTEKGYDFYLHNLDFDLKRMELLSIIITLILAIFSLVFTI